MSETGTLLLADARETLAREVARLVRDAPLEEALAAWVIPSWEAARPPLSTLQEATDRLVSSRDYRDAAAAGFSAAILARDRATAPTSLVEALSAELEWLAGRPYQLSNGNYARFFSDAPALLGIALGAQYAGTETAKAQTREWLSELLPACSQRRGLEEWELCLLAAAAHACDLGAILPLPEKAGAALIALRRCKALPDGENALEGEEDILKLLLSPALSEVTGTQATFLAAAYDWVRRAATVMVPGRATIADVAGVLRGIQASLHRWTWEDKRKTPTSQARQWHVENEYHVQNLLWVVLRPMFPDLVDEFYAEPIGQKRPRADIGIPSLRLIIEAKFMRASASPQSMIGEIAEDTGLYLTADFAYDAIIPFIWDNVPRPQEHDVMRQGMIKMDGIADVVIISRPDVMVPDAPAATAAIPPVVTPVVNSPVVSTPKPSDTSSN